MATRLQRNEEELVAELKRRLPHLGDRLLIHQDGRRPWTLDPARTGQPRPKGWMASTFYSLQKRGLLVIEQGPAMSLRVGLAKDLAVLTPVQQKLIDRIRARIAAADADTVMCRPGPHRMRFLGTDVLGSKEETYRQLETAGLITIEYTGKGSTGPWIIGLAADSEGVAQ